MKRLKVPSLLQSDNTLRTESPSESGQKLWQRVTEAYATERVGFLLGQYAKARPKRKWLQYEGNTRGKP